MVIEDGTRNIRMERCTDGGFALVAIDPMDLSPGPPDWTTARKGEYLEDRQKTLLKLNPEADASPIWGRRSG